MHAPVIVSPTTKSFRFFIFKRSLALRVKEKAKKGGQPTTLPSGNAAATIRGSELRWFVI